MGKMYIVKDRREELISLVGDDINAITFTFTGKYIGTNSKLKVVSSNSRNPIEVDVVSFLSSSSSNSELAISLGGVFKKIPVTLNEPDMINQLNNLNGLLYIVTRKGKIDDIKLTQYIYIFKKDCINNSFKHLMES